MALEETPWLVESRGGDAGGYGVLNVLDPKVAKAQRESALAKLRQGADRHPAASRGGPAARRRPT